MDHIIEVTELALCDAHQSLIATRLGIDDMIEACEDLDNTGFWSLECWGTATIRTRWWTASSRRARKTASMCSGSLTP